MDSRYKLAVREEKYRIYMSDALKVAYQLNVRYVDFASDEKQMTDEEIAEKDRKTREFFILGKNNI